MANGPGRPLEGLIQFGDFELDTLRQTLSRGNNRLKLQPQPLRVLELLIYKAPEVVSREEIQRDVWGDDVNIDIEQSLNYCIRQIRLVLGDAADDPQFVETVPRQGYRFTAALIRHDAGVELPPAAQAEVAAPPAWFTRRHFRIGTLAIGVVALLAVAMVFLRKRNGPSAIAFLANSQLSTGDGLDVNACFSPDGHLVAYASDRTGSFEIFVRTLESGSEIRITGNGGENMFPSFSPDGQSIAFSSAKRPGIYVVPVLGGAIQRHTEFGAQPVWSPDGKWIAFVSLQRTALSTSDYYWPSDSSIWIVPLKGGLPRQITSRTHPMGSGQAFPSWSADGGEIRFVNYLAGAPSLWTYRLSNGALRKRFERPRSTTLGSATFSHDNRLLFYVDSSVNGVTGVWALRLNAATLAPEGEPEPVYRPSVGVPRDLALSPDGKKLLYSAVLSNSRLMVLPTKGGMAAGEPKSITREVAFRYGDPAWSPDSRSVAYTRFLTAELPQVWIQHLDGSPPIRAPGPERSCGARFLLDGKRLRLASPSSGPWPPSRESWKEVSLDDGSVRELGETEELAFADISPDGKEVVYHGGQPAFQVWKLRFDDGKRTQLTYGDEPSGFPHYSPDGKWLSLERIRLTGTEILVLPATGGKPEPLWSEAGAWLPTGWSPDGDKVLLAGNRGSSWNLYWVSRSSRKLQPLLKELPMRTFIRFPRWSPDGSRIVYELNESKGNVFLAEMSGLP
jgi:Tol biopolymer transport system component/DNA-binding winged helix-turn-helix (wHTH) protein